LQKGRGPELSGKFFAKVEDSNEIVENIKLPQATELDYLPDKTLPETEAKEIEETVTNIPHGATPKITWQLNAGNDRETFTSNKPYDITTHPINLSSSKKHTHPVTNNAYFGLTFCGLGQLRTPSGTQITSASSNGDVLQAITSYMNNLPEDYQGFRNLKPGTKIKFATDAGVTSQVYEIVFNNSIGDYQDFWDKDSIGTIQNYFTRIWEIKLLDTTEEPYQEEPIFLDATSSDKPAERIWIVSKKEQPITGDEVLAVTPAVFETEPAELADLDLYHEISNAIGIVKIGSTLKGTEAKVANVDVAGRKITLDRIVTGITNNETKTFVDTNGFETDIVTSGRVSADATENAGGKTVINVENGGHVGSEILPWFNCFTFGNGIESNRIRDDFNQVFIDKGPKVSTVLERDVVEEHKKASLIYSGIYVNKNGINETNQFLIADKITKDLNPEYGSIQKLEARDSNLISCNEDKIINIVANKDAIFNADGNPQLIASTNVLGQAVPYTGEYGISKNPESFVSYAYRSYFTDKARGVVLRLSRDGLTDISGKGMSDYFGDNLQGSTKLIGSYSEDKSEYILTLHKTDSVGNVISETAAFSESSGEGSILDSLFTFTRADTGKELTTYQINRLPYTDLQGKIIVVKKPLAISLLPNLTREELDKFTFKVGVKNGGKVIGQEFNELKAAVKSKFIPDIKNGLFKNYFSKGAVGGGQVDFVLKHLGDEGLITYHAIDMFGDDPELTVDDQMSQRLQETTNIDPGILFSRGIKPTFRQPFSELYRKAGVNN